jgi:amino acid transporter
MAASNKFGTFSGVFTPSILTILGVIMYLRLPMIIGEAGLLPAIGIIVVAHIISFSTGLSVSSIATDKKVRAGGTYYIISRSLGLPIGGTLGLALFVGLSFSVSLYLIGFAESFLSYWGWEVNIENIRIAGTLILLTVTTITFISTSLAIRTQYFIMAAIILSLLSIFFGKHEFTPEIPLVNNSNPTVPLMVLFGIFFPAVTGFEAGVSMSGDLKDPKKSIPKGTITAVLVGFVAYIGLAFFFTYTVDSKILAGDPAVLTKIAFIPELVVAGIWGATLSSALGSILGAPRILQATATDRITPRFFAKGYGQTNEPRHALLLTFIIAEAGILIGELDVIARVVSIFFITTYGFLNLSSAFEYWTSPDFRPEFKIPAWVSIIGSVACFIVMIELDLLATFGATLILGLLFVSLKKKQLTLESGDAWSGIWASLVNTGIQRLNKEKLHFRNWRPNILMFRGSEEKRPYMVTLGLTIKGRLGVLTDINLNVNTEAHLPRSTKQQVKNESGRTYFRQDHHCKDLYSGIEELTRIYGFSGVEPNTIFMGWSRHLKNKQRFVDVITNTARNNFNLIFLDYKDSQKFGEQKNIDIWWSGSGRNLSFAMSALRHFTASGDWHVTKIRLMALKNNDQPIELIHSALERILEQYRMQFEIKIVDNYVEKLERNEIISRESGQSDLVILDFAEDYFKNLYDSYSEINELLDLLGSTLLVYGSDLFENIDVGLKVSERKKSLQFGVDAITESLPELKISVYSEVAAEVNDAKEFVGAVNSRFYEKSIISDIESGLALLEESSATLDWLDKELARVDLAKEKYRKEKLFRKIKNDLYFRFREQIRTYSSEELPRQADLIGKQIKIFDQSLLENTKAKPSKLRIVYLPDDLNPTKSDSRGVRFNKWVKRIRQRLKGRPVSGTVPFRKTSKFFLYESRHRELSADLDLFLMERLEFHQSHKQWIRKLLAIVEDTGKTFGEGTFKPKELKDDLQKMGTAMHELKSGQHSLIKYYGFKEKEELTKHLQQFNNYLERIHAIGISERRQRSKKYFQKIITANLAFGELFGEDIRLALNSITLELQVNAVKNRVYEVLVEYLEDFKDKVSRYYLKQLSAYLIILESLKKERPKGNENISLEFDRGLKFAEDYQILHRDILALVEQWPESITVSKSPGIVEQKNSKSSVETLDIPLRKIGAYFLESRLISPLEQAFEEALTNMTLSIDQTGEVNSLVLFSIENIDSTQKDDAREDLIKILDDSIKKIAEQERIVNKILIDIEEETQHLHTASFEPLGIARIRKSTTELSHYLRDYQGRRVISRFGNWGRIVRNWMQTNLLKILYSRSEGVLLAKRLQAGRHKYSLTSQLLDINDMVSPAQEILKQLPPYYVNLFSGRSSIGKEFWIERPFEMSQADKAFRRYDSGRKGGILVVGERNSGKTLLSKHMTHEFYKEQHVYQVFPPSNGSLNEKDMAAACRKASGAYGSIYQIMATVPAGKVWILHDLELWWERSESGMKLVHMVGDLIDRYSSKFVFIVNINPYALAFINRMTNFNSYFIETIHCRPFDAQELRDLILRRHETSGLKLTFRKGREELLSEVKMASLFHDYFSYSSGNPGVALNAWLANIRQVYGDNLLISKPDISGAAVFRDLPSDWYVIAAALVLHKRLDVKRLLRLTEMEKVDLEKLLLSMQRAMVITERMAGLYILNQFMEPHLVTVLKEKDLL